MKDLKYKPTTKIDQDEESEKREKKMDRARAKARAYLKERGIDMRLGGTPFQTGSDVGARIKAEQARLAAEKSAGNVLPMKAKETK